MMNGYSIRKPLLEIDMIISWFYSFVVDLFQIFISS